MGVFVLVRATRPALGFTDLLTRQQHAEVAAVAWAGTPELWRLVMDPMVLTYIAQPTVTLALIGVWAFPLAAAAWLRGMPAGVAPPWGALDGTAATLAIPRLHVPRAAVIGAVGGVAVFALGLVLRLIARAALPDATRDRDEFALAFYFWNVGLGVVAQGVVAAVVAATTPRAPALHGLLAATLTGAGGALALIAQPSIAGCLPAFAIRFVNDTSCAWVVEAPFALRTFQHVVSLGFVAALVGAGVVALVRWAAGRRGVAADGRA
jgi:hypothetical protein